MFNKKSLCKTVLAVMVCLSPLTVSANALTITNNTKLDSTCIINDGVCSTILGEGGITRAGHTNVIAESKMKLACIFHLSNCKADVYMTDNCTGPKVATVMMDLSTGIKSIDIFDNRYQANFSGFTVSVSGGPQLNK